MLIVGAGPAGISASLRAIEHKLNYITLEHDEVGGTVAKYPRQKLVMTSPVEFPMYGKFKKTELSKENLLAFWDMVLNRADFNVRTGERRSRTFKREPDGVFTVVTANNHYRARAVVLALGRTGTPRKLGVKGEELPKVMYRLIEADHYVNKRILVVGAETARSKPPWDWPTRVATRLRSPTGKSASAASRSETQSGSKTACARGRSRYSSTPPRSNSEQTRGARGGR